MTTLIQLIQIHRQLEKQYQISSRDKQTNTDTRILDQHLKRARMSVEEEQQKKKYSNHLILNKREELQLLDEERCDYWIEKHGRRCYKKKYKEGHYCRIHQMITYRGDRR